MSEDGISINIDESEIEKLKEAINYDEIEARHQRFMDGTETEDDLINGIIHYIIKNDKGLNLDVVESKYYHKIVDLYQKEKNKELDLHYVPYEQYITRLNEANEKWKDKIRAKIDYYKKIDNAVGVKILERILEEK